MTYNITFGFNDYDFPTTIEGSTTITAQPAGGESYTFSSTSGSTSSNFDLNTTAPDITVLDWLKGTLKQFNLTCYPTANDNEYQVEPLQAYYQGGGRGYNNAIRYHCINRSVQTSII